MAISSFVFLKLSGVILSNVFVWEIFWIHGCGGSTMYWNWTIKLMNDIQWEPDFSLLEWEITYKQGEDTRRIHGVMDLSLRHLC